MPHLWTQDICLFLSLSFSLSLFFSLFFSLSFFSLYLSLFLFSVRSDCIELDFKEISYLVWFSVNFFIRNRSNKTVQHPGTELREPKHVQTSINWRYLQKFTYLARGISDSKTENNSSNWHYLFQGDVKKGGADLNWLCWLKNIYTKPSKFAIANCIEIEKFNTKKRFWQIFSLIYHFGYIYVGFDLYKKCCFLLFF